MSRWSDGVLAAIDGPSAAKAALELVRVESPSGHEREVADLYATMLEDIGLSVEIDRGFPQSPSVIARTPGFTSERAFQLCGHLDTVPTTHPAPVLSDSRLSGRGSADMKSGMAAILTLLRAMADRDLLGRSSVIVTAYGQHEEPVDGNPLHAPLISLLRRGIHGTACLIPEGPHEQVPISGRGLVIFSVEFRGPETSSHEVLGSWPADRNPVQAAVAFAEQLRARSREWTLVDEFAGGESYFLGRIDGGDLYNRVPVRVLVDGTRRYPVGRAYDDVHAELHSAAAEAATAVDVTYEMNVSRSGQPFRLRTDEPIVRALREGHLAATGRELPLGAIPYSADASQVMEYAGVPAVYHGVDSTTAHSDHEFVELHDIERCARVMAATVANYLEGS
jgi:acetylornithine deacetylase/succinyl-diaminopimelate desuccinylase-like protein